MELANTNLEILAIENALLTPPFDNRITQYTTEVSNENTNLKMLAVPEDENGKVVISGNQDIKEGNNVITVTVTAPNGITTSKYQVNVYKRNLQEEETYLKEQEEQKEELEQAYEIEKTSITDNENVAQQTEQEQETTKRYLIIGILIFIIILGSTIGLIYYKKRII